MVRLWVLCGVYLLYPYVAGAGPKAPSQSRHAAFAKITQGMKADVVRRRLGKPDQIHVRRRLAGYPGEAYRWAYGRSEKNGFARVGIVVFSMKNRVLHAFSPRRRGPRLTSLRPPLRMQGVRKGTKISCAIGVRPGKQPVGIGQRMLRFSLRNHTNTPFLYRHDHTGLRFGLFLEVYDARKKPVWSMDLMSLYSPYGTPKAKWPTMRIAPGKEKFKDFQLRPYLSKFGQLKAWVYYVRAIFPLDGKRYCASNLLRLQRVK